MNISCNTLPSQSLSTPDNNGVTGFTQSEIKPDAVHAGLSVLVKLSVTDWLLPPTVKLTSSSLHNILYLVIETIWDVTVVISAQLGNSL